MGDSTSPKTLHASVLVHSHYRYSDYFMRRQNLLSSIVPYCFTDNMAIKQGIDCWTSLSSTDGEEEGTLQSSHGHDEGMECFNVFCCTVNLCV